MDPFKSNVLVWAFTYTLHTNTIYFNHFVLYLLECHKDLTFINELFCGGWGVNMFSFLLEFILLGIVHYFDLAAYHCVPLDFTLVTFSCHLLDCLFMSQIGAHWIIERDILTHLLLIFYWDFCCALFQYYDYQ